MKHEHMRKILLAPALAIALLAGTAGTAGASPATTSRPAPLPALYNLDPRPPAVWDNPEVRPAIFAIYADGSGGVIGMHWARWNYTTAVTSSATDVNYVAGRLAHSYKVTMTLSDVRHSGGPHPGPYFTKMVIAGRGITTYTHTYTVCRDGSVVDGSWARALPTKGLRHQPGAFHVITDGPVRHVGLWVPKTHLDGISHARHLDGRADDGSPCR
jgi:hypothetical protein